MPTARYHCILLCVTDALDFPCMCPAAALVPSTIALSEGVGFVRHGLEAQVRFNSDGSCLQGPGCVNAADAVPL